jgi:hypothetical protein
MQRRIAAVACQWRADQPCQFADMGSFQALTEYRGREYCALHLPLGSDHKIDAPAFADFFKWLQAAQRQDFSGLAFPGAPGPTGAYRYDISIDAEMKWCAFGDRVDLLLADNCTCDLSESNFTGASVISVFTHRRIVCRSTNFSGDVRFDIAAPPGADLDLAGSRFDSAVRIAQIENLGRLNFDDCRFAVAPSFRGEDLPQKTSFRGTKFTRRAEDETAYREIRNYFHKHRARDAEGQFYAMEKRCQRLCMTRPRQWVPRALSYLYDLSSEYGYSYGWALFWFCLVQVVFALLYAFLSGELEPSGNYDSRVLAFTFGQIVKPFELFSSRVSTDGAYGIIPAGDRGWWLSLTAVQSVLSIALVALFLLAIRWRFRRE